MSLFRRLMTILGAGGAGYQPEYRKDANIFSDYNLCSSIPAEKFTAQLTSTYFLAIGEKEYLTASIASYYDLSTAPT